MSAPAVSRVVLVGFMGAGKTSVGRRVADVLGWRFVDLDEAVEAESGLSVPEIFASEGEAAFRAYEDRVADLLLREDGIVLGSGGGWAARPGRLGDLPPGTVSVWLDVTAEEAVGRTGAEPGRRPLLEVESPLEAALDLLRSRRPHYAGATLRVDTTGRTIDDVTSRILRILADYGLETTLNE